MVIAFNDLCRVNELAAQASLPLHQLFARDVMHGGQLYFLCTEAAPCSWVCVVRTG